MDSKIEKNVFLILLIFSIIILILTSSLFLTIFDKKFYLNFEKEKIKEIQNKTHHIENLLNYFQTKEKYISNSDFNQKEILHLYDVKNIIQKTYSIFLFFLTLSISILFYLFKTKNIEIILNSLILSGSISLAFIVLIIIFFLNFDFAFNLFHKLFFTQGTWLFNQQDLLIQLFPITFFKKILTRIIITALSISLVILGIGIKTKNKF